MISKVLRIVYVVILASLVGCASLAPLLSKPTPVSVFLATSTPQLAPVVTQTVLPVTDLHLLRVWLPPRFDPNADTASAKLLKQRLADFGSTHPRIKLEVRIKTETGDNSLLNSLSITSVAAPSALPDLVVLSRSDLEAAALKGLLHPVDGLSTTLHDPSWYPYARELGHIQNIGYGLPFAGTVLVMLHRPELKVNTWDEIFASKEPFLFSAGDPQAMVIMSLYVSAGGKLINEQGLPTLEEVPLTQTLTLIKNGLATKTFSPTLLNFQSDEQSLQAYHNSVGGMVVTWMPGDETIYPVASLSTPTTFANGWMWALSGSAPENQQLAVNLAEFLLEDSFLAEWISGMNYLPTRIYQGTQTNTMLESAHALPANEVLTVLGPILNQALSRVLNGEQVEVVVRSVMDQVK